MSTHSLSTIKALIGQQFFIGISGLALTSDEKKFIVENNIGGVCLFGRNVADPKQVRDLCEEIQSLRHQQADKAPLFIGIDMEGGRVHRLKPPFTSWPALRRLGDLDAPAATYAFACSMGAELKSVGINLDFAPCVDVLTNPANTVIGDRAISEDPEKVARHASALVRGYMKAGVLTCAKHFPGHGNTLIDSHLDLPIENSTLEELHQCELKPFRSAIRSRVDMVMTSHIKFPLIDPAWPVTLSKTFIQELLRKELKYTGFVITDDLGMKAMASHFGADQIPVRALQAGAELLLYCNEPETPPMAIEALIKAYKEGQIEDGLFHRNHRKILKFKESKLKEPNPLPLEKVLEIVGCSDHQKLAAAITKGEMPAGILPE
jgi:beta-N-acetylhexosaminidase